MSYTNSQDKSLLIFIITAAVSELVLVLILTVWLVPTLSLLPRLLLLELGATDMCGVQGLEFLGADPGGGNNTRGLGEDCCFELPTRLSNFSFPFQAQILLPPSSPLELCCCDFWIPHELTLLISLFASAGAPAGEEAKFNSERVAWRA